MIPPPAYSFRMVGGQKTAAGSADSGEAIENIQEDKIMGMELWQEKAQVLIEALPYIQRFNGKTIVVKYGGSAMIDQKLQHSVITDVALLKLVGFKPIIVHGGGKEISRWVKKAGKEPKFVNGLRVTDRETMEIAEMVLGRVNKGLVQMMESLASKPSVSAARTETPCG